MQVFRFFIKDLVPSRPHLAAALVLLGLTQVLFFPNYAVAQTMQDQLVAQGAESLARAARELGDARRGAIVFYQPYMSCVKCHDPGSAETLGPDLSKLEKNKTTDTDIVESILHPSKVIRKGFEPVSILTVEGRSISGLVVTDEPGKLVLRDVSRNGKLITLKKDEIEDRLASKVSIMPAGQVNQLASRQQFFDLVRYLIEIRDGGPSRALDLKPAPALYAARPLPEYESHIDHAGIIAELDQKSFKRGEAIYNRLCINCHGTHNRPGSLPTSLRFATGKFKNGSDPHTMYQTLTRGFGMMVAQTWMVPQQKYDVIHYVREAYLKSHNSSQFFKTDLAYLNRLPKGDTRGPKPSNILPWVQMDYGHNQIATYEIGRDASNFAYKGNAVRLDPGPGGVSRGRYWMTYDYDTLRVAAVWSAAQEANSPKFIDWNSIHFNGRHAIHPRIVGQVQFANPTGPGWANPETGSFEDTRLRGRDGRIYGPLKKSWAHYKGMYYHGNQVIVSYTVGLTKVLEVPGLQTLAFEEKAGAGKTARTKRAGPGTVAKDDSIAIFKRTFNIGPRKDDMILQVAHRADKAVLSTMETTDGTIAVFGPSNVAAPPKVSSKTGAIRFNGSTHLQVDKADKFDLTNHDYTIFARIKTRKDGTIFCKTASTSQWTRDGKSLFVRGGRLVFDIGWVGAVSSKRRVNDGKWHDVALTFENKSGIVKLYIDGKPDQQKELRPKATVRGHVVRIGYTSSNFPPDSTYKGAIGDVRFYKRLFDEKAVEKIASLQDDSLVARWTLENAKGDSVLDVSGNKHTAKVIVGGPVPVSAASGFTIAGLAGDAFDARWSSDSGNLRLTIPAGNNPLKFTMWMAALESDKQIKPLTDSLFVADADLDLDTLMHGGPRHWPDVLTTTPTIGRDTGAFASDVLTHPTNNPWFCRMRLSGFDFFPDGDRAAISDWDGSVWLLSGLAQLPADGSPPKSGQPTPQLKWQRIASGLFQPLGVRIVDGKIYVTCRDQICILHDLNGDGETDYYESFNNDHQVTDHFHEFAMGLQTDAAGNFYYAKSARHALPALVPHHGTLLRVSKDGSRTDILATGFRAANGVCLNPDGTFIVTDQEGHWNPKNRINWVKPGGFYGNMYGYHDITDSSDEAMEQPLCWITNRFDRSPAELLWVDSPKWGALNGSLLNLSYGYGKVYVVPHENVNGQWQGGMSQLPLQYPTGVMRGRFHPQDGQLYTCGMFAWAGSQQQAGGLYRLRYTGKPAHMPIGLQAKRNGMAVTFSNELDAETATDVSKYSVKVWSLKRTKGYGSKHYNEHSLKVTAAKLSGDRKTIFLEIPDISPTWCMEIKYSIKGSSGEIVDGFIHNTIHNLGD